MHWKMYLCTEKYICALRTNICALKNKLVNRKIYLCTAYMGHRNQEPKQAVRSHFYKQNIYEERGKHVNSCSLDHGGVALSLKGNSKGLDEKTEIPKGSGE